MPKKQAPPVPQKVTFDEVLKVLSALRISAANALAQSCAARELMHTGGPLAADPHVIAMGSSFTDVFTEIDELRNRILRAS